MTEQQQTGSAVVLVLASGHWISTARLVLALSELGCTVDLVAPANHPARTASAVRSTYRYDPLRPAGSLRSAIAGSNPRTLIAADEVMVQHLEDLWWSAETSRTPDCESLQRLIRRSLGGPVVLNAARSRMALLQVAQQQGIAIPQTLTVEDPSQLESVIAQLGVPLVLKADATSGGRGVRVAETPAQAQTAWRALHDAPSMPRALVRGFMRKEWNHLRLSARRLTREVTAQKFVPGRERTGMVVCRKGTVLASVSLEVVRTWCLRGPSSVVRVIEDPVMDLAMCRIAAHLRLSGFCGFDFIVEEPTNRPLLIEMNSRPTQLVHLPLGPGRDLIAAYVRDLVGLHSVEDRPAATASDLIALFPQELQRDPASEFLEAAFHDVPWNAPELIERALAASPDALLRTRQANGSAEANPLTQPTALIS